MIDFESILPTESLDVANIVRGILKVQAQFAAQQSRALGRGTHTKGICARATFEVFDVARTIADPSIAARLAHGIYAIPGVYPATVRFANAASTIDSDRKADLRALSFSIELPESSPLGVSRLDYSLQSAPTFPINDVHAFAVLMNVLSADNKLKALLKLPLADMLRVNKAGLIGKLQEYGKTRPYQQMRYWSTVPFRNGPYEAVKYSAIPSPANPAHQLQNEPNDLQDELIPHINEDAQMSSFDFGLQLLNTDRMTRWGLRRKASFWVENATVEWKESQAPFLVVGRLTLLPKSILQPAECEKLYIDVTENSTIDSEPIGSVNRGRHQAEVASRKVRLGLETADSLVERLPLAPPGPRSRLQSLVKFATFSIASIFVLYFLTGFVYDQLAKRSIPAPQHVDKVVYLDQGWGLYRSSPDRELYYFTPQGTDMHGIRYSWFVNLEMPFHRAGFASPDHMRALNFIVDPEATPKNPDHLPIGFARRYELSFHDDVVDITCAACHTGQLLKTTNGVTTAIRIDGGAAMTAFTDLKPGTFQMDMGLSLAETMVNPLKFNRFANKVLGPNVNTFRAKWTLWRNLGSVLQELGPIAITGSSAHNLYRDLYPTQEGYGRTDALARISNVVFGDHITHDNLHNGDGPVNYPYLWNIWKFNWVQYSASVSQPMARNVGEALGVGARFQLKDDYGRPVPSADRYRTSISIDDLLQIESTIQKLKPPPWPQTDPETGNELLGTINQDSRNRGETLFNTHCAKCHAPHVASRPFIQATAPDRRPDDPMWIIRTVDVNSIGTDPNAANNFNDNKVDLTSIGITYDEMKRMLKTEMEEDMRRQQAILNPPNSAPNRQAVGQFKDDLTEAQETPPDSDASIAQSINSIDLSQVNSGKALNLVGMMIRDLYYNERHMSPEARACFAGFGELDMPQIVAAYKPRPLAGVWATPPFLHNGSVPTIYALLSPWEERPKKFFVGRLEYDAKYLGYVTEPAKGTSGGFWFDTKLSGNHNTGHQFRDSVDPKKPETQLGIIGPGLTPQDRMDLIEYLKVLQDDAPEATQRQPINCFALLR